jgi:hypothetical protein
MFEVARPSRVLALFAALAVSGIHSTRDPQPAEVAGGDPL